VLVLFASCSCALAFDRRVERGLLQREHRSLHGAGAGAAPAWAATLGLGSHTGPGRVQPRWAWACTAVLPVHNGQRTSRNSVHRQMRVQFDKVGYEMKDTEVEILEVAYEEYKEEITLSELQEVEEQVEARQKCHIFATLLSVSLLGHCDGVSSSALHCGCWAAKGLLACCAAGCS
jgi:hypothetical protein